MYIVAVVAILLLSVVAPAFAEKNGWCGVRHLLQEHRGGPRRCGWRPHRVARRSDRLFGIKRSQTEIRKLELETAKLQAEQGVVEGAPLTELSETYNVVIRGNDNRITITADPRLLSPLLLLLDFVTATIILTIAGYLLNFGGLSVLSPILALLGVVLFAPMFREARRLKRALAPGPTGSGDDESTSS